VRQQPHRLGEPELLVQLDELDDVTADAAPEAMEETLVAVDLKRRRLLAVKWAEALVRRTGLLERHVILNHHHDVRLVFQVVDELLGEERH
jgi:hypothetical protein